MQPVVFDEPYKFVPPYRGKFWTWALGKFLPLILRRMYGIVSWKTSGLDHLRDSLRSGYGIILCPNHSRLSDPLLSGTIVTETPCYVYAMASWHVFKQSRLDAFVARRVGGFSVYREGIDRKALETAVEIVSTAERPLFIFPEGVISAANDRLMNLMEGTAFVARAAARKRSRLVPGSKVVIHPVGYKYTHQSDPQVTLPPILNQLETRLFWQTQDDLTVAQRICKLRDAVQAAREVQVLGTPRIGDTEQRIQQLVEDILHQYESEWLNELRTGDVIARIKDLRTEILKEMVEGRVTPEERKRRWRHLTDLYYAQCMSLHPPGYIDPEKAGERLNHRLFETLQRIEEELTDRSHIIPDLHVDVRVGEAMEVDPTSGRRGRDGDPLMAELRQRMLALLEIRDEWPPQPVRPLNDAADAATK